jgi:hypothetical protein
MNGDNFELYGLNEMLLILQTNWRAVGQNMYNRSICFKVLFWKPPHI